MSGPSHRIKPFQPTNFQAGEAEPHQYVPEGKCAFCFVLNKPRLMDATAIYEHVPLCKGHESDKLMGFLNEQKWWEAVQAVRPTKESFQ